MDCSLPAFFCANPERSMLWEDHDKKIHDAHLLKTPNQACLSEFRPRVSGFPPVFGQLPRSFFLTVRISFMRWCLRNEE